MVRQDLFRAVNERIQELTGPTGELGAGDGPNAYVCECGDSECQARISLTRAEFADVSAESGCLLVAPEHVGRGMEVVQEARDYVVVRSPQRRDEPVSR